MQDNKELLENLFCNLGLEPFKITEEDIISVYCNKSPLSEICTLNDQICYTYRFLEIKGLELNGELLIGYNKKNCYITYKVQYKDLEKDLEIFFKLCD